MAEIVSILREDGPMTNYSDDCVFLGRSQMTKLSEYFEKLTRDFYFVGRVFNF